MKTKTEQKQEIVKSRVGGFGGSDAKMFYKVGLNGLSALSDTDKRRIAVALGQAEHVEIPTTEAMEAGNEFEKWLGSDIYTIKTGWKNNFYLVSNTVQARNFKLFAHPDFYDDVNKIAIEAKYTSSDIDTTINDYMPQLQWYYLLGVKNVYLVKGTQGENFNKSEGRTIKRDDNYINILSEGIKIIDEFCDTFIYTEKDEWTEGDLLPHEQRAAQLMYNYLEQIKIMEAEVEKSKQLLFDVMDKNGVKSIKSDKYVLTIVPESVRSTFDKKKLLKEHPEINEKDYLKTSKVKPYLKIILK